MVSKLQKAFRISDGLASLVHKKITGLVRDLEGEGALTKQEGKKVLDGLSKVKKALYDNVSGELQKVLNKNKTTKKKK